MDVLFCAVVILYIVHSVFVAAKILVDGASKKLVLLLPVHSYSTSLNIASGDVSLLGKPSTHSFLIAWVV